MDQSPWVHLPQSGQAINFGSQPIRDETCLIYSINNVVLRKVNVNEPIDKDHPSLIIKVERDGKETA